MTTPRRPKVFRVGGIRRDATVEELIAALSACFSDQEKDIKIEASIVPPCDSTDDTNAGLVCFIPRAPEYLSLLNTTDGDTQLDTDVGELSFDNNFYGLTQLYPTPRDQKITADIIAVTGLDGHAYDSWRGKNESSKMWLRDFFSKDLPTCRTMIYGYNSKLCSSSIRDYNLGFLENIKRVRRTMEERERPLVFMGYSFGGIIVLQSLLAAAEAVPAGDLAAYSIFEATRTLMFFGTPHRGPLTEDILSMVDTKDHSERVKLVESIDKNNKDLEEQLQRFINITPRFRIVSFYELKKTRKLVMDANNTWSRSGDFIVPVGTDSALLNLPSSIETRIPVDKDHSTIVKFNSKQDGTYRTVVSHVWELTERLVLEQAGYDHRDPINSATKALSTATASGNSRLMKLLLDKGADPNGSAGKSSLLHAAAERGDPQAAELLLDRGARIEEAREVDGFTALHLAAQNGHESTVRLLLDRGAEIEQQDKDNGCKALHLAAQNGHEATVRLLIDRGADLDDQEYNLGRTPLFQAVCNNHETTVRLLLDRGASWRVQEWGGCTPLEAAGYEGLPAMVQLLMDYGAGESDLE